MRKISDVEAQSQFAELLDAVEGGETIVITRDGRPVARLLSRQAAVGNAMRNMAELRKRTGKITVEEILEWRDEGRRAGWRREYFD